MPGLPVRLLAYLDAADSTSSGPIPPSSAVTHSVRLRLPPWPPGFDRIPDEAWTRQPTDDLAQNYDTLERHGWYRNLDPTVEALGRWLDDGALWVDYSGGTGILMDRLFSAYRRRDFGVLNADSSPKFLRLSLQKLQEEPRAAFRLIPWVAETKRLRFLDEVLDKSLLANGVDGIVSTNAVHLYFDLEETMRSWVRCLRPGGRVHVQSGNIGGHGIPDGAWIIDSTVDALADEAARIVQEGDDYRGYRDVLEDTERYAAHVRYRRKVFLPVRPLPYYLEAMQRAGLAVEKVDRRVVEARTSEWLEFLSVYHDAILGWVGGTKKVDGREPTAAAVQDRMRLLKEAMANVFDGKDRFDAVWTYVEGERPAR